MSAAFFQALGRLALVFKLVVAEDGNVIARNYSTDSKSKLKLKPGDIGVHCRVDLGSTKGEYTPAQELALAQVAPRVADAFLSSCGVEPAGFSHGDIVKLEDGTNALVLQDKGTIMRVQKINDKGKLVRCTRHNENVEEVPVEKKGLTGLLLAELESVRPLRGGGSDRRAQVFELVTKQEDPFEHTPVFREFINLSTEYPDLQDRLDTYLAEAFEDSRACELLAELICLVGRTETTCSENIYALAEHPHLLQKVATTVDPSNSPDAVLWAISLLKSSFEGRASLIVRGLKASEDPINHKRLQEYCPMLAEDGVTMLIPAYDAPDEIGKSNDWVLELHLGGKKTELTITGLLAHTALSVKHRKALGGLRELIEAPEAFWRTLESGFDTESDNRVYLEDCCRVVATDEERFALLERLVACDASDSAIGTIVASLFSAPPADHEAHLLRQKRALAYCPHFGIQERKVLVVYEHCLPELEPQLVEMIVRKNDRFTSHMVQRAVFDCTDVNLLEEHRHALERHMGKTPIQTQLQKLGVSPKRTEELFPG